MESNCFTSKEKIEEALEILRNVRGDQYIPYWNGGTIEKITTSGGAVSYLFLPHDTSKNGVLYTAGGQWVSQKWVPEEWCTQTYGKGGWVDADHILAF